MGDQPVVTRAGTIQLRLTLTGYVRRKGVEIHRDDRQAASLRQ